LNPDDIPAGIRDSKALPPERREALSLEIMGRAVAVAIVFASAREIDDLNIRGATLRAMSRALRALSAPPDFALIDGRDIPEDLPCPARAVIRGDASVLSIAAASIVAKVARDALMTRLHAHYPDYGFASHAGYATRRHCDALARLGPTPLHRRSFRVKGAEAAGE
jgi:ribonuclease HII